MSFGVENFAEKGNPAGVPINQRRPNFKSGTVRRSVIPFGAVTRPEKTGNARFDSANTTSGGCALSNQPFDCRRQIAAKFVEQSAAIFFRQLQSPGRGVNEPARGLVTITEQSLPQGY